MTRAVSIHAGLNSVDPQQYSGWTGELNACEFDAEDMLALAAGNSVFGQRTAHQGHVLSGGRSRPANREADVTCHQRAVATDTVTMP
ncbi:UNVERIFIED_ORG: hypothetical protein J2X79_004288 [Arthrobacter globiformis]|nr:hypothetical protein [Arthrobacter globiformis]